MNKQAYDAGVAAALEAAFLKTGEEHVGRRVAGGILGTMTPLGPIGTVLGTIYPGVGGAMGGATLGGAGLGTLGYALANRHPAGAVLGGLAGLIGGGLLGSRLAIPDKRD